MPEATTIQSVPSPAVGPPSKKPRTRAPIKTTTPTSAVQPTKLNIPLGSKPGGGAEITSSRIKRPTPAAAAAAAAAAAKKKPTPSTQHSVSANMTQNTTTVKTGSAPANSNMFNSATPQAMNGNNTQNSGGMQRSYSGMNLSTPQSNNSNGTPNNGAVAANGDSNAVPYPDPAMRRNAMQALYLRYKQFHGNKVDDTTLQRMAAKLEQQIAMKSTNREEYTVNSQNEIKRIDMSQRMYGTPPQGNNPASSDPTSMLSNPAGSNSTGAAPTAPNANFNPAMQQQLLQRQMSQSMLYGSNPSADPMQGQMAANSFQQNSSPGNLTYQEFCQRMRFQPVEKLVDISWNQRLMIFQLQQENVAYKQKCAALQQMVMTMNMNMSNGYGNMQQQQYSQFQGGMKPMYNFGMQQAQGVDGQLSRQGSMNSMSGFSTTPQPAVASTPSSTAATPSSFNPPAAPVATTTTTSATPTTTTATAAPAAYWAKVKELKDRHSDHLKKAYQILCMAAQSGSRQTSKAESMKQNIHYAIVVLNEVPPTAQPREGHVLQAIESFIVESIVPLVRKVQEVSQSQQNNTGLSMAQQPKVESTQASAPMGEFTKQLFEATGSTTTAATPQTKAAPVPTTEPKVEESKENQNSLSNTMDDFADFAELDDLGVDDVELKDSSSSSLKEDTKRPRDI